MQLTFRIDDANYITVGVELSSAGGNGAADGPEVVAASVTDSKLSNLQMDQLLDIVGQVVDHFTTERQAPVVDDDWRDKFRRGEKF